MSVILEDQNNARVLNTTIVKQDREFMNAEFLVGYG